jgi:hypothetical protein
VPAEATETSGMDLAQYLRQRSVAPVKLHLGCGGVC